MSQLSCLKLPEIFDNIHQNSIVHSKLQETWVKLYFRGSHMSLYTSFRRNTWLALLVWLILGSLCSSSLWSETDALPVTASPTCLRITWAISCRVISSLLKEQEPRSLWYLDHYSHRIPTATSRDKCKQELIGELTSGEKGAVHLPYPMRWAAFQTELISGLKYTVWGICQLLSSPHGAPAHMVPHGAQSGGSTWPARSLGQGEVAGGRGVTG